MSNPWLLAQLPQLLADRAPDASQLLHRAGLLPTNKPRRTVLPPFVPRRVRPRPALDPSAVSVFGGVQ